MEYKPRKESPYDKNYLEGKYGAIPFIDHWKRVLPNHLLETVQIIGQGDNTINIVRKAIEEKKARAADPVKPPFDEVWAVFDKDDFPNERRNWKKCMRAEPHPHPALILYENMKYIYNELFCKYLHKLL